MNSLSRPLGLGECFFWTMDQTLHIGFVSYAYIRGELSGSRLAEGLAMLQEVYPLLRSRIVMRENKPWFEPGNAPVELVKVTGDRSAHWMAELERPFDIEKGPLLRCHWGIESGNTWVAITLYHSIGDARSGARLLVDLLRFVGTGARPEPHPMPPPLEATYDPTRFGAPDIPTHLGAVVQDVMKRMEGLNLERPVPGFAQKLPERRSLVHRPWVLPAPQARKLRERCRANGTTVHGLLGAVYMQAVHRAFYPPGKAVKLSLNTPVDVRSRAGEKPTAVMGIGVVDTHTWVTGQENVWELARTVREDIHTQIQAGIPNAIYHLVFSRSPPQPGREASVAVQEFILKGPWASMLTNMGEQPAVELGPHLKLTGMGFTVAPLGAYMLCLAVGCYEELRVDAVYDASHMPAQHAEPILKDIWKTLEGLD